MTEANESEMDGFEVSLIHIRFHESFCGFECFEYSSCHISS